VNTRKVAVEGPANEKRSIASYRLRLATIAIPVFIVNLLLMTLREVYVSSEPLEQFTDSSKSYRIVSIIGWIVFFTSLYAFVPWYVVNINPDVVICVKCVVLL
jgi:hypothetical protein